MHTTSTDQNRLITSMVQNFIRWFMKIIGFIAIYDVCVNYLWFGEAFEYSIHIDNILQREISPNRAWVALVYHRYSFKNLSFETIIDGSVFDTTITDTVFLVRPQDEDQFVATEKQSQNLDKGAVTRYSQTGYSRDRPLIHWLSANQLDVTAPENTSDSYIVLSGQSYGNLTITFSFTENSKSR